MAVQPWKRIEPTNVFKAGYRTMVEKHFRLPSGLEVDRTIMNEDSWAAVCAIALTTDNQVILARQFRPGPERTMNDLPGGIVDAGEELETCMVRELSEETGYRPGSVEYLGDYNYDAYVGGKRHYYLLTDCEPTGKGAHQTPDEDIEILLVSIDELFEIAKRAEMADPGALWLAYDKLMALKER
jgi:ADP-ribose pyrophosphatase